MGAAILSSWPVLEEEVRSGSQSEFSLLDRKGRCRAEKQVPSRSFCHISGSFPTILPPQGRAAGPSCQSTRAVPSLGSESCFPGTVLSDGFRAPFLSGSLGREGNQRLHADRLVDDA